MCVHMHCVSSGHILYKLGVFWALIALEKKKGLVGLYNLEIEFGYRKHQSL